MKYIIIVYALTVNLYSVDYKELLFTGNCTTCHFINKTVSAPSIIELKDRYLNAFPEKNDFVEYMAVWVQHPNPTMSLMNDAIDKYEIMPELGFGLETLREIAEYIYITDFKQ